MRKNKNYGNILVVSMVLTIIILSVSQLQSSTSQLSMLPAGNGTLVYSTGFEDVTKVGNELSIPVAHMFGLQNGGTFWVENTATPTLGAPSPRTGQRCLGLSTPAVASGTLRSEFALGFYSDSTWEGINDDTGGEIFISVWLYLPSDWDLHQSGYNWYEIVNGYVCLGAGDYPRMKWWIGKNYGETEYWTKVVWAWDAGDSATTLGMIKPFVVPKGEWFNLKWYVYRHETNGIIKAWMSSSYYGTNYLIADVSGYQTRIAGDNDWYSSIAKVYHDADGYEHKMWLDDVEVWNGMPPSGYPTPTPTPTSSPSPSSSPSPTPTPNPNATPTPTPNPKLQPSLADQIMSVLKAAWNFLFGWAWRWN